MMIEVESRLCLAEQPLVSRDLGVAVENTEWSAGD